MQMSLVATRPLADPAPSVDAVADVCSVDLVTDAGVFEKLAAEWNDAVDRAAIPHPFLRHEWLWTWWEAFGHGRQLHVVIVRSGGRIVAIAPLVAENTTMCGVPIRQLRLMFNDHTPRADVIVAEPGQRAYRAMWDALLSSRGGWDVLLLGQLPRESATRQIFAQCAAECGMAVGSWRSSDSPYLALSGSWDGYFRSLPAKFRSNVRNRIARLERAGRPALESIASVADIEGALPDTFRLEASGWKQRERTSITSSAAVQRFYTTFAYRAALRGWLRLQFLKVGERRVATSYSLVYGRRLFLCKTGYDPAFDTGSPFKVLTSRLTEQAYADGLDEVDFLGDAEPWKREWTTAVRSHEWLYVFSTTIRARLAHRLKFGVVPALRRTQHPST